jgi:hypothetical protein
MGNAQVMTAKVAWDNACYWAITALLFFQRKYTQPEFIASIDGLMRRFFVLHARMQQFLNAWNGIDARDYGAGFTSVVTPEWLRRLQAELGGPAVGDDALRARLHTNFALLEQFARALQAIAREDHGERQELSRFSPLPGPSWTTDDGLDIEPLRVLLVPAIPIANPQPNLKNVVPEARVSGLTILNRTSSVSVVQA